MMKAKLLNIAAISALVLGAGAGTALASANGLSVGIFNNFRGQKPDIQINLGLGADLKAALEAGDYQAWVAALGDKEHLLSGIINEDNFDRYAEAWRLDRDGDHEAARAIYEDLGLDNMGIRKFVGGNAWNMDAEARVELQAAIENRDYAAWVELMGDMAPHLTAVVDATNFGRYAEAWELQQEGDFAAAKEIYEELGIGMKMKGHMRWDRDDDGDRQAKAGLRVGANAGLKLGLMGGSRH